jgi:hypothetical protein
VPARACLVTLVDERGIRHAVEVTAETVFDAAAGALAVLAESAWTTPPGPATRVEVQVPGPSVTHTVTVQQLARWAQGTAASPDERLRKDRVHRILERVARPARR